MLTICQAEHTFNDADDRHNLQLLAPIHRWWEDTPEKIHAKINDAKLLEKRTGQIFVIFLNSLQIIKGLLTVKKKMMLKTLLILSLGIDSE